jgi:hypothetical protein
MLDDLRLLKFRESIVSYPERGPWGDARYRGNCTGFIVRSFLATYHPSRDSLFVDPMEGSGTSRHVASDLGIRYAGFDLRDGFDATRDDLFSRTGEKAASIWLHPPYANMLKYSGRVWGECPHDSDLSWAKDIGAFSSMLVAVLRNVYRALEPGGHYGVLMGSLRRRGKYFDLPEIVKTAALGDLVDILVKTQHNVRSNRTVYSGAFVPIAHEHLLIFRRPR